jgi:hypothetical protein
MWNSGRGEGGKEARLGKCVSQFTTIFIVFKKGDVGDIDYKGFRAF